MVIYKDHNKSKDVNHVTSTCNVQGTVIIGSHPKWRQFGDDEQLNKSDQYICVQINEANVFRDINDGGDA